MSVTGIPQDLKEVAQAYESFGTAYPTWDDLPFFRGLYKQVQHAEEASGRPNSPYYLSLRGWLHFEHGLVLSQRYPDQAALRFTQAADEFVGASNVAKATSIYRRILLGAAGHAGYHAALQSLAPAVANQAYADTVADRIFAELHRKKTIHTGYLSELAIMATVLIPSSSAYTPVLATPRQDTNTLPINGDCNHSLDMWLLPTIQGDAVQPIPTQIKYSRQAPLRHDLPYSPNIVMLYGKELLGITQLREFDHFHRHIARYAVDGTVSDYLHAARENIDTVVATATSTR